MSKPSDTERWLLNRRTGEVEKTRGLSPSAIDRYRKWAEDNKAREQQLREEEDRCERTA